MSRRRRKSSKIKHTHKIPAKSKPVALPTGRFWWVLGVFTVVLVVGVLLLLNRSGIDRSDATIAAELPATIQIPDLTNMQSQVAERVQSAHATVVSRPDSVRAWGQLGAVCQAHGLNGCAASAYRAARMLAPDEPKWCYLLAIVRRAQGASFHEVLDLFANAKEKLPNYAPLFYRIGTTQSDLGDQVAALDAFRRALELDPSMAIARRRLGQVHLARGEIQEAFEQLKLAAAQFPDDGPVYNSLTQVLMRMGNRQSAEVAAARARTLQPTMTLSDPIFNDVEGYAVGSDAALDRADSFLASGVLYKAIEQLKILAEAHDDDPFKQMDLALVYLQVADIRSAEKHFVAALQLRNAIVEDENIDTPLTLSLQSLNEVIVNYWAALPTALIAREAEDGFDRAIASFESMVGHLPSSARAHLAWGHALRATGRPEQAKKQYAKAVQLNPSLADAVAKFNAASPAPKPGNP